jgi:hypothetical protein
LFKKRYILNVHGTVILLYCPNGNYEIDFQLLIILTSFILYLILVEYRRMKIYPQYLLIRTKRRRPYWRGESDGTKLSVRMNKIPRRELQQPGSYRF